MGGAHSEPRTNLDRISKTERNSIKQLQPGLRRASKRYLAESNLMKITDTNRAQIHCGSLSLGAMTKDSKFLSDLICCLHINECFYDCSHIPLLS